LHSGYLDPAYRDRRRSRLQPSEIGGAIADLGSHAISLLIAFLGDELAIIGAKSSGSFEDVPCASDLCASLLLTDERTGAAGSVTASRISAGSGDLLELEIWCTNASLRLSTLQPDMLYLSQRGGTPDHWEQIFCGNDYKPASAFPAANVPAGWLRSLMHAQYLFFGGSDSNAFQPGLDHGLAVQRLVRQCAQSMIRNSTGDLNDRGSIDE
jgi:predicted dehydrogenase